MKDKRQLSKIKPFLGTIHDLRFHLVQYDEEQTDTFFYLCWEALNILYTEVPKINDMGDGILITRESFERDIVPRIVNAVYYLTLSRNELLKSREFKEESHD